MLAESMATNEKVNIESDVIIRMSYACMPLQLPAAAREEAELICSNVQLEMALIDDLLDWTRVMKNKLQLREKIGITHYTFKRSHVHYNIHFRFAHERRIFTSLLLMD